MSIRIKYNVRTLFVSVAICAVTVVVFRLLEASLLITAVLMGSWVGLGFAAGWLARPLERHTSILWPAAAFLAFNWTCWYFNRLSLNFVQDARDRYLTSTLSIMTRAHGSGWFEVIAVLTTATIVSTAWRQSIRGLCIAGGVSALLWTVIAWAGYLHASASLIDVR